jgi:TRAP-type C4-dicarboxylate transport system permease small subunit
MNRLLKLALIALVGAVAGFMVGWVLVCSGILLSNGCQLTHKKGDTEAEKLAFVGEIGFLIIPPCMAIIGAILATRIVKTRKPKDPPFKGSGDD